jgi:hypothetical protein
MNTACCIMSEKIEVPLELPDHLEEVVQKIVRQSGYTRDEVIEQCLLVILNLADGSPDKMEKPAFLFTVKKALESGGPTS